ncbi:MAG: HD domain-containing protein [Candidatus Berkelbacteria bacterium]
MNETEQFAPIPYQKIDFKDGSVEIPTKPLCDIEQIHAAQEIVDQNYPELASMLREGHPWREMKNLHALQTQEQSMDVLVEEIGFDLNDPNARLAIFISEIHDLGRVIDGLKNEKLPIPQEFEGLAHHGQFSVKILEEWHALDGFPAETQEIIKFAVEHHANKSTAALPENASDLQKTEYVYNCIFRDIDKLTLLVGKGEKYLYDPKVRSDQFNIVKGKVGQDEAGNERFLGENGQVTQEAMDLFLNNKLNDVNKLFTYETYMLNVLGFIFDINLVGVLKNVAESGIVEKFLNYFEQRLSTDQFQAINQKVHSYLEERGIELSE